MPSQCFINEFNNRVVIRFNVFNYDKESIRVSLDDESGFEMKCESLSSSGTYIQYYAAYVRFYYVKCLERQRKPLSIYDSDLNEYKCVNKLASIEVVHVNTDAFEVKLNKNDHDQEEMKLFNRVEIKKACVALKPIRLSDIEELSVQRGDDGQCLIVELNQEFLNENECEIVREVNEMSKKEFMMNFSALANSEHLDEDDDKENECLDKGNGF